MSKKKYNNSDSENESEETDDVGDIIAALEKLNFLSDEELSNQIAEAPKQYGHLFLTMAQFLSKSCGNINKIYEMALSLEFCEAYDKEKYTITHVKNEYGADIVIMDKKTGIRIEVEVKSSAVKKKNNYHTNWNFTLNSDLCEQYYKEDNLEKKHELEKALIDSLHNKMKNGFVVLQAMHGNQKLAEYKLTGVFMSFFCVTKILLSEKSHNLNLGCDRCKDCGEYHRITILQKYEKLLSERIILLSGGVFKHNFEYFDSTELAELFTTNTPTNCGKKRD
jgi:hypothetical protein